MRKEQKDNPKPEEETSTKPKSAFERWKALMERQDLKAALKISTGGFILSVISTVGLRIFDRPEQSNLSYSSSMVFGFTYFLSLVSKNIDSRKKR